jgi:Tfp pilus assembly protein PilP
VRWKVLALLLALVLLAIGCEKGAKNAPTVRDYEQRRDALMRKLRSHGDDPAPPAAAPDTAVAGGGLTAEGTVTEGYTYQAEGKRDPFRSFVLEHEKELSEHERGPLEQFDLNQLQVVAVVWDTNRPRALIEDPSGRDYIVSQGTAIGKNEGLVIRIDDNTVLVRETYVDYIGEKTQKEIEMRVRSTQGG